MFMRYMVRLSNFAFRLRIHGNPSHLYVNLIAFVLVRDPHSSVSIFSSRFLHEYFLTSLLLYSEMLRII